MTLMTLKKEQNYPESIYMREKARQDRNSEAGLRSDRLHRVYICI